MILCENLVKIYKTAESEVVALQGLDLTVDDGEIMAIIGNSGSGKSTLLNMLGGLDRPSAGRIEVDGKNLVKFTDKDLMDYKCRTVGFVWQNNARNLIHYLTAFENIQIPMLYTNLSRRDRREKAKMLLSMVGLSHREKSTLSQLSGGEQQRVAIAIGLANSPKLLLADEPTGAVDSKTASTILDVFRELNRTIGVTIVIVTHDRQLSRKVDRVVAIRDGRTSSEFLRKAAYTEALEEIGREGESMTDDSHEELVVLDRAGRIQIPAEYIEALGIKEKRMVKMKIEGGQIIMDPPRDQDYKARTNK
jgi:ABC-type lipoprotein export system ATPase subunit